MRLDHEFSVAAPIEDVWDALLDPVRVAPCMPGATLTGVDGDTFTATVKVKLGAILLTYKGKGEFLAKDEAARTLVIKASGKDVKGAGTASATVTLTLTEKGRETHGAVATDLKVTGRPAQFGRGLMSEVAGKLLGEFATCLSTKVDNAESASDAGSELPAMGPADTATRAAGATRSVDAPETGQASTPKHAAAQPVEAEPIDLMSLAGSSVLKRVAPVVAAAILIAVVIYIVRAARR